MRDLDTTLAGGKDSRHQFKRDNTNADGLAAELATFANSGGTLNGRCETHTYTNCLHKPVARVE